VKFEGTPEEVAALLSRPDLATVQDTIEAYANAAARIRELLDRRVEEFSANPNDRVRLRTTKDLRTDVRALLAMGGL